MRMKFEKKNESTTYIFWLNYEDKTNQLKE
jgi:hypothetical protein